MTDDKALEIQGMSPYDILGFINQRGGVDKLTDEERNFLSAMCEKRIAQIKHIQQIGEGLVSNLQTVADEPWRAPFPFQLGVLACLFVLAGVCFALGLSIYSLVYYIWTTGFLP